MDNETIYLCSNIKCNSYSVFDELIYNENGYSCLNCDNDTFRIYADLEDALK